MTIAQDITFEDWVKAFTKLTELKPMRKVRDLIRRVFNKPVWGSKADKRKSHLRESDTDFLNALNRLWRVDDGGRFVKPALGIGPDGWWTYDLATLGNAADMRPRTVSRYIAKYRVVGILDYRTIRDDKGRFIHQLRYRPDRVLAYYESLKEPNSYGGNSAKTPDFEPVAGSSPDAIDGRVIPCTSTDPDFVSSSSSDDVAVENGHAAHAPEGARAEVPLERFDEQTKAVINILKSVHPEDEVDLKLAKKIDRWVFHPVPHYRLTSDKARLYQALRSTNPDVFSVEQQKMDLPLMIEVWPSFARFLAQFSFQDKITEAEVRLQTAEAAAGYIQLYGSRPPSYLSSADEEYWLAVLIFGWARSWRQRMLGVIGGRARQYLAERPVLYRSFCATIPGFQAMIGLDGHEHERWIALAETRLRQARIWQKVGELYGFEPSR